jgi:alkane 1-monooxygenase
MKTLRVFVPYSLPLSYLAAVAAGADGLLLFTPALILFVGVPIADRIVGEDRSQPVKSELGSLARRIATLAPSGFVVLNIVCLAVGIGVIAARAGAIGWLASTISLGAIGSIGISAAHELIHRKDRQSKIWGRAQLLAVAYIYFETAHLFGHHRNVGTSKDHSTARYGESLYAFIARTVPGCFSLSWTVQRSLLERQRRTLWHVSNLVLWGLVLEVLIALAIAWSLGGPALLAYLSSAGIAIFLLESVSYVEHYGLMRETSDSGHPRRVEAFHSWDSYYAISGAMSFMLQRHADHHCTATRAYSDLRVHADAPELPCGYPTMIALAMAPALWRRVMHPRLASAGVVRSTRSVRPSHRGRSAVGSEV